MGSINHQPIRIAIIGGGIAGLALAASLTKQAQQHQLDVHVYESVAAHADVGAGLALHKNAIAAMGLLGPDVRQAYFDAALPIGASSEDEEVATEVLLAQGPHAGELVATLGRAKGRKSVSRADLLAGLLALVPAERVHFGKRLFRIWEVEEDIGPDLQDGSSSNNKKKVVHIQFRDCTTVKADVLLGADGIHSQVRRHLLGDDHPATLPQNHDRWQVYRTLVTARQAVEGYGVDPKWTQTVPIMLGPAGHVNCIPLNKGTMLSAGVAVRGAAAPTSSSSSSSSSTKGPSGSGNRKGERTPLNPDLYADYTPAARAIVALVAADPSASWDLGDHDDAPTYARGSVAMLGDAAHASLPFAGNGAAQALEDAAVLACLFLRIAEEQGGQEEDGGRRDDKIPLALAAYDAVRRPRSQAVVELARKFGRVYAYAEDGMHEDPERLKKFFAESARFTNEFDVAGQNRAALERFEELVSSSLSGGS